MRSVVAVLQVQWPGDSYDLLARNCNHFCETFGEMLGVGPIPGWVNRFATNADATVNAVTYARDQIRVVGEEIGLAATAATNWLISGFTATEPALEEEYARIQRKAAEGKRSSSSGGGRRGGLSADSGTSAGSRGSGSGEGGDGSGSGEIYADGGGDGGTTTENSTPRSSGEDGDGEAGVNAIYI